MHWQGIKGPKALRSKHRNYQYYQCAITAEHRQEALNGSKVVGEQETWGKCLFSFLLSLAFYSSWAILILRKYLFFLLSYPRSWSTGWGSKISLCLITSHDGRIGKCYAYLLLRLLKITTKLQNSHLWESPEVRLNGSPTTKNRESQV